MVTFTQWIFIISSRWRMISARTSPVYPDQEEAAEGVANHLRNFWEARMRREIVDYAAKGGDGLSPLVREAVAFIATESVVESEEVGEG